MKGSRPHKRLVQLSLQRKNIISQPFQQSSSSCREIRCGRRCCGSLSEPHCSGHFSSVSRTIHLMTDTRTQYDTIHVTDGRLCAGYHLGVLNTALEQIAEDVGFDPSTSGALVVSFLLLGAAAGSLSAGQLADRLGPKTALLINNAPLVAGSVLCMLAPIGSQGLPSLYAGGPILSFGLAVSWLQAATNILKVHAVQGLWQAPATVSDSNR